MPAPSNTTPATAIVIPSLPYTNTQTVDDAGTTYDVWYKLTCDASMNVIGAWGFGGLGTYNPTQRIYKTDPLGSPYQSYQNRPTYLAVQDGLELYFKYETNGGNPTPAVLNVSILAHQDQTAPDGSIAVVDTVNTYPIALLDATDATSVLRYVAGPDIVGSEYGASILPNGILCLGNSSQVALYDANYNTIAFVTPSGGTPCRWVGSNNADRFYISSGWPFDAADAVVWTCDSSGTQGPTTWTLAGTAGIGVRGIAPSPDETILYYIAQFDDDTDRPVSRWDLVNDVALADLAAGIDTDTYMFSNILCLSDGSVLVGYINDVAMTQFVRRYSAAGAVLDTYALTYGNGGESDLLARGLDDTTFWVWLHDGNTLNSDQKFVQVQVSDGTILQNLSAVAFDGGRYMYSATATPLDRFGHSYSCPFWITRSSIAPNPPSNLNGPPALEYFQANGLIANYPIVRVRRFPHTADTMQRLFHKLLQIDAQVGVGDATTNPTVELRWSNDGGATFTQWRDLFAGKVGEYHYLMRAFQLGMARDRVYEIRTSDPFFTAWLAAYIDVEEGLN